MVACSSSSNAGMLNVVSPSFGLTNKAKKKVQSEYIPFMQLQWSERACFSTKNDRQIAQQLSYCTPAFERASRICAARGSERLGNCCRNLNWKLTFFPSKKLFVSLWVSNLISTKCLRPCAPSHRPSRKVNLFEIARQKLLHPFQCVPVSVQFLINLFSTSNSLSSFVRAIFRERIN